MIGIVIPSVMYRKLIRNPWLEGSLLHEYRPLSQKHGMNVCFYCFSEIRNGKQVHGLVYSPRSDTVNQALTTIPSVNLCRNTSYIQSKSFTKKINRLQQQNIQFINLPLIEQGNKLNNYRYLSSVPSLRKHIPDTSRLSQQTLEHYLRTYGKVIIKPIYGSKGRGMTVITKGNGSFDIYQTSKKHARQKKSVQFFLPQGDLPFFFKNNFKRPSTYLVQQWIPFMTFNDRPFDMRAAVQKNGKRQWQLTSCVARVAKQKGRITNLQQGGDMVSLSKLRLKNKRKEIVRKSLEIAQAIEKKFPWAADMGVDLAIDLRGKIWFIEANFCSEKEKWTTIYRIPFEHALSLHRGKKVA